MGSVTTTSYRVEEAGEVIHIDLDSAGRWRITNDYTQAMVTSPADTEIGAALDVAAAMARRVAAVRQAANALNGLEGELYRWTQTFTEQQEVAS